MTVSILLVVLFGVLWLINYRNSLKEVYNSMNIVLEFHEYNITIPGGSTGASSEGADGMERQRSYFMRNILFSVSENGDIDYQTMYSNYPYLSEYDDVNEVVNATIKTSREGKSFFRLNDRFYRVASNEHGGHIDYIFFDWTTERMLLFRSACWLSVAFFFATASVGLLAYVHSDKVLDPVKKGLEKGKSFISNASHELKTPLTIISANLSVIQSEPNSTVKDNEKWFETIEGQIKRTNTLIMDMLELSKLEDHKIDLSDSVDLSALTISNMLSVEALCFEKCINVSDDIEEGIAIKGNKSSLDRLVLILLDNAIKYTPYAGNVEISLKKVKKNIILSVVNSGDGIKADDLPFVFERFYKGDRARTQETNSKSFGLGLAIAKSITEHHGGKIECFSDVGKDTEFRVTFRQKG